MADEPTHGRDGARQGDRQGGEDTPKSEWVVAGISLLLVVGAIAFLVHDAVTSPVTPPDIRVTVDSVETGRASYIARFTARNLGGSTGSNIQVSGELRLPDDTTGSADPVERSVATLDFVPASSTRRGGLYFTRDPRRFRLVIRAEGFNSP